MSLNYNFTKCEHAAQLRDLPGLVECVTFACMFVGIDRVTEKNLSELKTRVRIWETAFGNLSSSDKPISSAQLDLFVGFRTNASPMTNTQFGKNVATALRNRANDAMRREMRDARRAAEAEASE